MMTTIEANSPILLQTEFDCQQFWNQTSTGANRFYLLESVCMVGIVWHHMLIEAGLS